MSQTSNEAALVNDIFNSMVGELDAANPNQGFGMVGEWPPEGETDNFLVGIAVDTGKIKEKSGLEVPCVNIQFKYKTTGPVNDKTTPLEWSGARFQIPRGGTSNVTEENRKTVVRMETERLKGHLKCILGRDIPGSGFPAAIAEVQNLLSSTSGMVTLVVNHQARQDKRPGKTGTYHTEYLMRRIDRA